MPHARDFATLWSFVSVLFAQPLGTTNPRGSVAMPLLPGARGNDSFVLVPFPASLRLLDVLAGTRRATPWAEGPERPDSWAGLPAFDERAGQELLERALAGVADALALIVELRDLAVERASAPDPAAVAALVRAFRRDVLHLGELSSALSFGGVPLLDGSTNVFVFRRSPGPEPVLVDLPALTVDVLGLSTSIDTLTAAQASLDLIDTALDEVALARARLALVQRELEDGSPEGGLSEVERLLTRMSELAEQSSSGYLNSSQRMLLDLGFQADLQRIEDVAEGARFQGLQGLLDGGRVYLQGAPPAAQILLYTLPVVTPDRLLLSSADLRSLTSAADVLVRLDLALESVAEQRAVLLATRAELADGLRFPLR